MSMNLPGDLCPLESQVAGHTFDGSSTKFGMLRDPSGKYVFKPLTKPFYAKREISFYQRVQTAHDEVGLIKEFIPKYHCYSEMQINGKKHLFIQLENLTYSMAMPCVMDIKVGRRTWDPLATPEKIEAETTKYAFCKRNLGLCIPGFQIYDANGELIKYGKEYGKKLFPHSFRETLVMFLSAQNKKCYKPLVKAILNQLYSVLRWFNAQTSVSFYSSSILIAYDYLRLMAYVEKLDKENEGACPKRQMYKLDEDNLNIPWLKVKMIDFAHVFDVEVRNYDTNYLFGLQNLVYLLQDILIEKW